MTPGYNLSQIEATFKRYLVAENVSSVTCKNYLSDLRFFFSWIKYTYGVSDLSFDQLNIFFSAGLIASFNHYLLQSTPSEKSRKRKMSSLRKFFSCCISQGWLTSNPYHHFEQSEEKSEIEHLLSEYKMHLQGPQQKNKDLDYQINIVKEFISYY